MEIFLALVITLAIEVNTFIFLDRKNIFLWLAATAMNIVLNVSMNIILLFIKDAFWYYFTLSTYEIMTFIVEGLIIYFIFKYRFIKCLLVSLIANASSLIVGLIVNQLIINMTMMIIFIIIFTIIYNIGLGFVTYRFSRNRFSD